MISIPFYVYLLQPNVFIITQFICIFSLIIPILLFASNSIDLISTLIIFSYPIPFLKSFNY